MPEESRRAFLTRYAVMALAALAPNGARAAKLLGDPDSLTKDLYGPPPSPYPTLHPQRTPPVALYGPPTPLPTLDPRRPPPPVPVYGPPPRNPPDE